MRVCASGEVFCVHCVCVVWCCLVWCRCCQRRVVFCSAHHAAQVRVVMRCIVAHSTDSHCYAAVLHQVRSLQCGSSSLAPMPISASSCNEQTMSTPDSVEAQTPQSETSTTSPTSSTIDPSEWRAKPRDTPSPRADTRQSDTGAATEEHNKGNNARRRNGQNANNNGTPSRVLPVGNSRRECVATEPPHEARDSWSMQRAT